MTACRVIAGLIVSLALVSAAYAKDPKLIKRHKLSDGYYPTYETVDMDGDKDLDIVRPLLLDDAGSVS